MALTDCSVALAVKGTLTNSLDLKSVTSALNLGRSIALSSGTGAGQADKLWDDTRTIAASSNDDLDLAGAALLDPFGAAVVFAKVKAIIVAARSTNTNNVVIGGAGATAFVGPFGANTHTAAVKPGGLTLFACSDAAGWAVGAGATDILRIANGGAGTDVVYDIVIIGTSA